MADRPRRMPIAHAVTSVHAGGMPWGATNAGNARGWGAEQQQQRTHLTRKRAAAARTHRGEAREDAPHTR